MPRKLGRPKGSKNRTGPKTYLVGGRRGSHGSDIRSPAYADVLLAPEGQRVVDLARSLGLTESVVHGMMKRIRARFEPVRQAGKQLTTTHFLSLVEQKLDMALNYIDDYVISQASAKDLAIIAGIFAEKRQLFRGEPTSIIGVADRETMEALLKAGLEEAQRRGITIDTRQEADGTYSALGAQDPRAHPRMGGAR